MINRRNLEDFLKPVKNRVFLVYAFKNVFTPAGVKYW